MTEKAFLSDADFEQISAYLDNQLSPGERAELEARFEQEPNLRAARDELRATVGFLRELEPVRLPRSFTLDPAMVQRRPFWHVPAMWLRAGSALAVIMLAITLSLDVSSRGGATGAAAPAAPAAASEASAGATGGGASSRAAVATSMPASESGAGATGGAASSSLAAAPTAAAAAGDVQIESAPAEAAAPTGEAGDASRKDSPVSPQASANRSMSSTGAASDTTNLDQSSQPGALAANPGVTDPQSSSPGTTSVQTYQTGQPQEVRASTSPLLLIEIGLAALAGLLLLASFWVARRRN